ncbi:MAG TPA: FAD-dependent monooxygenase [Streptosporangiaceae bacterium]|nr:FAD-dependent monooxygenase [Streptosporangiaceae bacterium]
MSGLRVAVAGGGLGGLCLAQGLLKAGVDVTVYERDAQLAGRRQGYRLHVDARAGLALEQCLPHGSLALFQATCSEASTRLTVVSERLRVLNEQHRTGSADPYAPATLSTSVNRQTLREVLAAGLDRRLVFGCELTGYELTGSQLAGSQLADWQLAGSRLAGQGDGRDGVRLHFADGRQAEADLLVGADGVGSAVRRQYLPAAAPADTGKRCVYGTIPLGPAEADRLPSALRDGFTAVIGGQVGMATGVVRFRQRPEQAAPWLSPAGDYLMWAVAGDGRRFGVPDERLTAMSPAELHALTARLIRNWHPDLRTLHARAAVDETFLVRIRTSPPVPPWPPSRVTVLGDAIHAMSPARGSGANTALQDAALLCRMLTGTAGNGARTVLAGSGTVQAGGGTTGNGTTGNGVDLIAAVGEYERQMRDYGYAAVAASRAAEAETGARHNRLMFWLYRRMTGARA